MQVLARAAYQRATGGGQDDFPDLRFGPDLAGARPLSRSPYTKRFTPCAPSLWRSLDHW